MGMTIDWAHRFKALGDRLAQEPITPWSFERAVLDRLFPIEDDSPP